MTSAPRQPLSPARSVTRLPAWALLLASILSCMTAGPDAAEIQEIDRQRLVAHLEMTAGWFLDEVSNLSQAQLGFRRSSNEWSVMDVIDHLVVVGQIYWDDLQKAVKASAPPRASANRDVDILWYGIDRTNRETALKSENPSGQIKDLPAALNAYRSHHARLLQYVRTTKDDLRGRFVERQGSDAYQWALLISTHEQRHILQIREIKSDPKFPKK